MANWISWIDDSEDAGKTTVAGVVANGPTHGIGISSDLNIAGLSTFSNDVIFTGNIRLDGQLKDGDDEFGSSGQVLSSDGTDTKWVSTGSLAAGAASQVAINDDSDTDAERFITLVDSSSGNNNVKTDASLKYNPSTNTITTVNITGNVTGNVTGDLTGDVTGNISGNAGTATVLQTARNIGGVSFNGSAAIDLPGVNQAGNQNTSGNAATATVLATARNFSISGDITANAISFNGNGDVALSATIDNNAVDKNCMANEAVGEAELHISNDGTNGQFLAKRSGNSGGLTWETVSAANAGTLQGSTLTSGVTASSLTSLGTLTGLTVQGTVTINNGNNIELKTSSGHVRGYIQATETNDAHLIIATSGGEDISFRDGGVGGGVNMRIRGDGNVIIAGDCSADSFTGNVTGNVTGSSGSCTGNAATSSSCSGNAATATTATTATNSSTSRIVRDSGAAYHPLVFVDSSTDNQDQVLKMDDDQRLQWHPSSELLTAQNVASNMMAQWNGSTGSSGQVITSGGSSSGWTWTTPFSGSYNDLSSKPTIPTNTNQLTNGAGFLTSAMTGNSKVTIKTSGSGTHTTQSWCRTLVAAFVGGGGGGGSSSAYHDDDDPSTYGAGGAGGTGGVKFRVATPGGAANFTWSVGGGGGTASGGGNTTFGGSTAGGGGGGGNAGNSGNAGGGSAGSGDIPGRAGGTGSTNNKNQYSPFWGAYGSNGYGRYGTGNGPTSGIGGCIIILELG